MNIVTITLLIANLVTVAAGITVIERGVKKINKQIDDAEARSFAHMCKFTGAIKEDIESLSEKVDKEEIKKEIKNHISKEFLAMAFRDIRIVNLKNRK